MTVVSKVYAYLKHVERYKTTTYDSRDQQQKSHGRFLEWGNNWTWLILEIELSYI